MVFVAPSFTEQRQKKAYRRMEKLWLANERKRTRKDAGKDESR